MKTPASTKNARDRQERGRGVGDPPLAGTRTDLNLYAVLHAVIRHSNATRAAAELGVTPSAVSHALARLRKLLGDELFIPTPSGLIPTSRTLEIAPVVAESLARLGALVRGGFDPAHSSRCFRVAMSDYLSVVLMPPLLRRLRDCAPGVRLRLFPSQRPDLVTLLDNGGLDLAIGWFGQLPARVHSTVALIEHEAMIVREGHELLTGPISRERLLDCDRVIVEFTGGDNELAGGFLIDRGVHRRVMIEHLLVEGVAADTVVVGKVAATVAHYAAVPPIVEATDLVGTLPGRLARLAEQTFRVRVLDLPYEPLEVRNDMVYATRSEADAGLAWLLGEIRTAAASVA